MEFAGIALTIRDDARKEIQKDVDALVQSPKHYTIKAERARTYFPIMERIFSEEQVPADFKFLALQESALTAEAVSVSNAVGFWQFKDFTAIEMGLRVDREVDERMNLAASTRAAARYIKKNNTFFNNWIYALQAYQMGAGGVLKSVKESQNGATRMEINSDTYWYVKRYLAHKIAYEEGVKGKGVTEVIVYENTKTRTLGDLARELAVDETELFNYNKWAKSGTIPGDRTYLVLVPIAGSRPDLLSPIAAIKTTPASSKAPSSVSVPIRKKINGLPVIQAAAGEDATRLASRAGVELEKFLEWNDLGSNQTLRGGEFYFLSKKRIRAIENFHKVEKDEDLWLISQHYGVRLKKLKKFNRLGSGWTIAPGTMLWLASKRPKSDRVQKPVANPVDVSGNEEFGWAVNSSSVTPSTETVVPVRDSLKPAPVVVITEEKIESPPATTEASPLASTDTVALVRMETPREIVVVQPAETAAPKTEHVVQAGETLYAIAKMHQLGVMDLVNWNDLNLQQGIHPGQVLKLVPGKDDPTAITVARTQEILHEVKPSDTLYSIARQYSVTIKELMDWNGKKDFSLSVGEKLKILQGQ
jgi:membrane-bound lytic murein transglycosylase D